jgi:predicted RNA-binding Zn-ribbon protein involved in translation (DUF1610 family)
MTRMCCPSCRLRFTPAAAASLKTCPTCGEPLREQASAVQGLGYQLHTAKPYGEAFLNAVAVALADPDVPR